MRSWCELQAAARHRCGGAGADCGHVRYDSRCARPCTPPMDMHCATDSPPCLRWRYEAPEAECEQPALCEDKITVTSHTVCLAHLQHSCPHRVGRPGACSSIGLAHWQLQRQWLWLKSSRGRFRRRCARCNAWWQGAKRRLALPLVLQFIPPCVQHSRGTAALPGLTTDS